MSKSASTATLFPAWKQEVNRRVAAHLSGKTPFAKESTPTQDSRMNHRSRAAQAAARVAQRYAQAPSYSELLADEARNAMRAAEAASQAAQQAQAAVQYVLDGLAAAGLPELIDQPEYETTTPPAPQETLGPQPLDEHSTLPRAKRAEQVRRPGEAAASRPGDDRQILAPSQPSVRPLENSGIDDPGEPIYPNLIQFPRPMVATRRMRPRRAEGPLALAQTESQLSIFEVDPESVSTMPASTVDEPAAPVWMRAEESISQFVRQTEYLFVEEAVPIAAQSSIHLAPINLRLMAFVVDASLTLAAYLSLSMLMISRAGHLPGLRSVELAILLGLLAAGAAYQALFLVAAKVTPGMRYAGLALSNFEGQIPSRSQRCKRLAALALSVLPLGLGMVWALFDEDGLTGHDRLSKTYLRKR